MADQDQPKPARAPDAAEAPKPTKLDELVDAWRAEKFRDTCVARDVEVWNLVHAATEDLKLRLARLQEK